MKNSLFMRAVAAASAVPVALTQCLTVASAVSVSPVAPATANDSLVTANDANDKEITLTGNDGLLYIQPQELFRDVYVNDSEILSSVYGITEENTFVKDSNWNILASSIIANAKKKSGKIDPEPFKKSLLAEIAKIRNGAFTDVAAHVIGRLTDEDVTFEIVNNDIIVKAHLNNGVYYGDVKNAIGGAMAELADAKNAQELKNVKYTADASGDFKLTIHTSTLATSTSVAADFEFVPTKTGKAIGFGQLPEFALDILNSLTDDAIAAINACDKLTDADKATGIKNINSGMDRYKDKFTRLNNRIDNEKVADKSYEYSNITEVIAAVNQEILARGYKKQIPATASEIMANPAVKENYETAVEKFNNASETYTINIAADLLGAQAERIYDIKGSRKNGVDEATAKYPDDEQKAVKDFFATSTKYKDLYEFQDSWKEIKVEANFKNIDDVEAGSADVKFYRVVKVTPKNVVTTTTTETTVTTDTTVTTVTTDNTPVTTDTTVTTDKTPVTTDTTPTTEPVTTDTTVTTDKTPITTDTTPTTEPVTTDTTVTTVTTDNTPVTTDTTVTTDDTPVTTDTTPTTEPVTEPTTTEPVTEPVTTTSTTEVVIPPVTTRTEIVNVPVINADKTIGFYLDVDEEFHKEQVTKLTYSINTVRQYIDENNTVLTYESIATGEPVDITDKFDFGFATPVNTYNTEDLTFAYQVALKATEDITAADGTVVAKKGGSFKNPDNSDVSVTAYIGVKGDANLDNKVDSGDATTTLVYYAALSTGSKPADTTFSISKLVQGPNDVLDHFAAFLCDTTNEPYPQSPGSVADNWKLMKGDRQIQADDATFILSYYTELSLNAPKGRETWNKVQGLN